MPKFFSALRALLVANDYDQSDLAEKLKRSKEYVSLRFRGLACWTQDEMYEILDFFNVPHDQLHIIFPRGGKRA